MPRHPKPLVDVDRARALGFGLDDRHPALTTAWHAHRRHQILHAVEGSLTLEDEDGRWLLPGAQAAWIPARRRHRTHSEGARLQTVYLAPSLVAEAPALTVVMQLPALGEALIQEALSWPAHRRLDRRARALFVCIAEQFGAWARTPASLRLPQPRSEELAVAMGYVIDHLAEPPTLAAAARCAGLSSRTLERRFRAETGGGFREYLLSARMIEAQRLLRAPHARVSEVAYALGYSSPSAFSTAFVGLTGRRPKELLRAGSFGR